MAVKYLNDLRHDGAVREIAKLKFPFPDHEHPDFETLANVPKHTICAGQDAAGKDLFPDIVVVRRPGQWLLMMAEVETPDTLTDDSALTDWKPMSLLGDLFIYVPAGCIQEAKKLCKRHGIHPKGFRTWRFRPVWGLEVTES